jgi:hypothetical protein
MSRQQHSERRFNAIQAEIDGERAAALGRAGRRVEDTFRHCQELLATMTDHADDGPVRTAYREARASFDHAMYAYVVQREAIGLVDHRDVRRAYPRPPHR